MGRKDLSRRPEYKWPVEVERTERAAYWQTEDGTYFATSPSVILPPPVQAGGYYNLDALKRLKGDLK